MKFPDFFPETNPLISSTHHEITVFLWFSCGFPMVSPWCSVDSSEHLELLLQLPSPVAHRSVGGEGGTHLLTDLRPVEDWVEPKRPRARDGCARGWGSRELQYWYVLVLNKLDVK